MTNIYNRINNYSPNTANYHNMNMQYYYWIPHGDHNEIIHHKSYNTEHGFSQKKRKAINWQTDGHSFVMYLVFIFIHHTHFICTHYRLQVYAQYAKQQKLGSLCDHEQSKIECPTNEEHESTKIFLTKCESF